MYKKYFFKVIILLFISILLFSSCETKSIYSFDENIKELLEWSVNEDKKYNNIKYKPISSDTLAEMSNLDANVSIKKPANGIIIGVLYFKSNQMYLNSNHKDLLFLVAKAQKFEKFNILIESNNIKHISIEALNEIEENFISNGVKKINISINHIGDNNNQLIIKIIKLL